jgi:hypothetical protein
MNKFDYSKNLICRSTQFYTALYLEELQELFICYQTKTGSIELRLFLYLNAQSALHKLLNILAVESHKDCNCYNWVSFNKKEWTQRLQILQTLLNLK